MKDIFSTSEKDQSAVVNENAASLSYDFLNNNSEIAARIDVHKQLISASPEFEKLFGYSSEELTNQPVKILFPDEYESLFDDAIQEADEKGRAEFETQAIRKDGSIFYKKGVLIKGITDETSLIRFYYFAADITQIQLNKIKSLDAIYQDISLITFVRKLDANLSFVDIDYQNDDYSKLAKFFISNKSNWYKHIFHNKTLTLAHLKTIIQSNNSYEIRYEIQINDDIYLLKEIGKIVFSSTYQEKIIAGFIHIEDIKNQKLLYDFKEKVSHSNKLEIFSNLVKEIALETGIDYVFIAEPVPGSPDKLRTLAFWAIDNYIDNFEYVRENTPCDIVFSEHALFIEKDVQKLFPLDLDLVDLEVESYIGNSIINFADEVVAHIALMHKTPQHKNKQLLDKIKKYKELTKIAFDIYHSNKNSTGISESFKQIKDEGALKKYALYLYENLQYEYVAISELTPDKSEANTLILLHKGKQIDNLSYFLKDTPCENLLTNSVYECDGNAKNLYKNFDLVQSLNINHYLGHVVYGKNYSPIGLVCLLSSNSPPKNEQSVSKLGSISYFVSEALTQHQYELELLSYKNAALSSSEAFAYFDNDLFIQFYNDKFSDFFDSHFNLQKDSVASIFSNFEFGEDLIEDIKLAKNNDTKNEIVHETWFNFSDNNKKYVKIKIRLISNEKYDKPFILINIADLTDLRETQNSLIESKARFSHSIDMSPDMIFITRVKSTTFADANKSFLEKVNSKKQNVIGKKLNEVKLWQKNRAILKHIAKLKKQKTVLNDEIYIKMLSGDKIYFELSSTLYNSNNDEYAHTVLRDISVRKKNESSLKKQKQKLKKNNNTLKVLNEFNSALSKIKNEAQLLDYVCDTLISTGQYYFCGASLFKNKKNDELLVSFSTLNSNLHTTEKKLAELYYAEPLLDGIDSSLSHILFNNIPAHNNIYPGWEAFCLENNLHSCLILPLKMKKIPIGVIGIFSENKSFFDYEDIRLLNGLTERILYAIRGFHQKTILNKTRLTLVDSESKFKNAFGNAPVGMCLCNEEGYIFDCNQSIQDTLNINYSDLVGSNIFDYIHNKDREKLNYCFLRLIKNKVTHFSLETCCVDTNGMAYDFFCNCSSIPDNHGNIKHIIFHFQDISSRKVAERALLESEERFRLLYNGMPSMFLSISSDRTIRSINKYGAIHLGYNITELTGQQINMIISSNDQDKNAKHIDACFSDKEKIHRWQLQFKHKNNDLIWTRITARLIYADSNDNEEFLYIVAEDISETQRLSEKLSYQATHDPLTGLSNRIEFERRLKIAMETREHNTEHALCYMDLDNFKIINDTSGHLAGDELLRQLSLVLKQYIRQTDVLARLGGDEFGILMENCSLKSARRTIDNIRKIIEEFRFVWQDKKFNIGVSIGLVPITESFSKIEDIMSAADAACYTAKDTGRNKIHIYFPNDLELNRKRGEMEWVSRIDTALENDRFELYFQEIQPIKSKNSAIQIELLLRLIDDDNELIPPGAFLSSAERYHIITKLDRWVIETALRKLCALNINEIGQCNINISGQSIGNNDFSRFLFNAISEADIPANILCFEVTETAAIANLSSAVRFIRALKMQGCSFALDDFGSGVSSFGYLKNLPVDYLKIDGAFVRDIKEDAVDFTMVKSINDIGQVMKKKTVAEFVENEVILSMLNDIGVDYAQGYHIHKPEPIDKLIERLQ